MSATDTRERPPTTFGESPSFSGEEVRRSLLDFHVTEADGPTIPTLFPRRRCAIQMMVDGHRYSAIARELGISRNGAVLMAKRCVELPAAERDQRTRWA